MPTVFLPVRYLVSSGELASKMPMRCSKVRWPEAMASEARMASGTWPSKGMSTFFDSSAMAK